MTTQEHSRLLGIFFAVHAGIYAVGILIAILMYGGLGVLFLTAGKNDEKVMGVIFLVAVVFVFIFSLIILIPQILAAVKLLKNKPGARFWSIFGSITALLSFPLGTALGVYGLVFLFGEQGKYLENKNFSAMPPPPPTSWR